MKMKIWIASLVMPVVMAACSTVAPDTAAAPPAQPTAEARMAEARACEQTGNYQKAFIIYSELQSEADDVKTHRALQMLRANALFEMRNYPAALAALAPMPEMPATLDDCRKMILAARILQSMKGKPEHVEALLEVALDNSIDDPEAIPVKAGGYAELGKIYVANGKNARAIKCFENAAQLYEMDNDEEKAKICRNIMEYLR